MKRVHPLQIPPPNKSVKIETQGQPPKAPPMSKAERAERSAEHKAGQAQSRRFERSTNGLPGMNKAPESVILAMAKGPSSRASFIKQWADEGEGWGFAEAREEVSDTQTSQHKADHVWLTTGQMEKEGLPRVLIDELVSFCEQDSTMWRPHPTVPWVK